MPGKKILMLTGEFTEEYEIFVFQQGMEAVGHTVHVDLPRQEGGRDDQDVAARLRGSPDLYRALRPLRRHQQDLLGSRSLEQYDAVYCAGGRGPEYIRTDKRIQAIVKHFHDAKKPIFTICHGVQILVAVDGVVRGKKVGALGACEPEVTLAGGTYIDVSPTDAYVDGTMVSAKGWTALAAFMRECLKVLGTEIRHGEVCRLSRRRHGPRLPAHGNRDRKATIDISSNARCHGLPWHSNIETFADRREELVDCG